jgi:chromosome segregation ATPase
MPTRRLVNRLTWDGRGGVYIEEHTFQKLSQEEIPDDCLLITHDFLYNRLVEELKRTHRLLHENSQSNNQLIVARGRAEDDVRKYQKESYALQAINSNLQTENNSLQTQLTDKERQIQWGVGQLTQVQTQLATIRGELTQKQARIDALTQQFNALQIEKNNKDNEINNLRGELGQSWNIDLRYREKKLDELIRNSGLNQERERIDNLRVAYERLKRASDNYNQEGIATAQNEIDAIKRRLFQTNASVDDLHKIYKVCEKVAELRIKSEQTHQQQFEARIQQAPPPGAI